MSRNDAKAFTLVELLVVVSIISLLVAMLMPALQRAVELSYRTTCKTNCREIARACQWYSMETRLHRGGVARALPNVGPTSSNWHSGANANRECMRLLVTHKALSPRVLMCPSLNVTDADRFFDKPGSDPLDGGPCGYSFLSMVRAEPLSAGDLSTTAVLVADRNPRFAPNSNAILGGVPAHANSNTHRKPNGQGEGQNIGRLDGSAGWAPETNVNTGSSQDDYIYESDSPGSDGSGKASGPGDILLLN